MRPLDINRPFEKAHLGSSKSGGSLPPQDDAYFMTKENSELSDSDSDYDPPPMVRENTGEVDESPTNSFTQKLVNIPEHIKKAISPLAARFKGWKTRSKIVSARKLKESLDENIKDSQFDSDVLSKILARQILDLSEKPDAYTGHGKKKEIGETHHFPVFDEGSRYSSKDSPKSPTDLWVRQTKNGKGVEIEFKGDLAGSGAYKDVHHSKVLHIDLSSPKQPKTIRDSMQVHFKGYSEAKVVLEGISQFLTIPENVRSLPDFRAAGILTNTDRKGPSWDIEATDIPMIAKWQEVPGDDVSAYYRQVIQVLRDVATTLELLHQEGFVHRDVKEGNVLGQFEGHDELKLRGYLADWDTVMKTGQDQLAGTAGYRDILTQNGIVTPLTDIYALSLMTTRLIGSRLDELPEKQSLILKGLLKAASEVRASENQETLLKASAWKESDGDSIQKEAMRIKESDQYPFKNFLFTLKSVVL